MRFWLIPCMIALAATKTPALALDDPFKPGKLEQVKLGKQVAAEVRKKEKVLKSDDPRSQVVQVVFSKIIRAMTEKQKKEPWEYQIDVIESKEVNAFALPGGQMFIYSGLLEKLKTRDELAGVIGHEITHVLREHWAYQVRDQQKRQIGLLVLLGAARANRDWFQLAGAGEVLLFTLPMSRSAEYQADEGGYELLTTAGFNPQGMVDVFKLFNQLKGKDKTPEFMSTHPDDRGRISRLEERIKRSGRTWPASIPLKPEERFKLSVRLR